MKRAKRMLWLSCAGGLIVLTIFILARHLHTLKTQRLENARRAVLRQDWAAVLAIVEQIPRGSKEYAAARRRHATALLELDRPEDAWCRLQEPGIRQLSGTQYDGNDSDADLVARAAFETGRLEIALQTYGALVEDREHRRIALRRMALIHCICGRRTQSRAIYERLLREGALNQNELVVLTDLERPVDITDMTSQWERSAHTDADLQVSRLHVRFVEGRTDQLTDELRDYVTQHPEDTAGQAMLGLCLVGSDAFAGWFQRLPADAMENPEIWLASGRHLTQTSRREMAARCYWQALRLAPCSRRAHYELGQVLTSLQHPDASRVTERAQLLFDLAEHLDRLLTEPQDESALRQTTENLQQQGRLWEAAGWAVLARQHYPDRDWPDRLRQQIVEELTPQSPLILPRCQLGGDVIPVDRADVSQALLTAARSVTDAPQEAAALRFESGLNDLPFRYLNGADPRTGGARMFEITGGGIAVLDFEQDGWPDVFFPQGGQWPPSQPTPPDTFSAPDALYRNYHGQSYELCPPAGIPAGGFGQGCAAGDFNNDGFSDLLVANVGGNQLLMNLGDGTFQDVSSSAGLRRHDWTTSCAIADLDRDSTPDLFAVNYVTDDDVYERVCQSHSCSPGVFQGVPDELLLGDGTGGFTDPHVPQPLSVGNGLGLIVAGLGDTDALDVFVANDQVQNAYLHNQTSLPGQLQLESQALARGLAYSDDGLAMACMGIASGDANGDGRLDLFVTNFRDEPNTLYLQNPGRLFLDATRQSGLRGASLPYVGWGTQFVDADNDGRQDLAVLNGHVDPFPEEDGGYAMPAQLFRNRGHGDFRQCSEAITGGFFSQHMVGRSLVRLDWNRDGRTDLIASTLDSGARLATNTTPNAGPNAGHWIHFSIVGTRSSRDAIGTRITISSPVDTRSQQLVAGDGYMASNQHCLMFGLGNDDSVEMITVDWPNGKRSQFHGLKADQHYILIEPQAGVAGRVVLTAK